MWKSGNWGADLGIDGQHGQAGQWRPLRALFVIFSDEDGAKLDTHAVYCLPQTQALHMLPVDFRPLGVVGISGQESSLFYF